MSQTLLYMSYKIQLTKRQKGSTANSHICILSNTLWAWNEQPVQAYEWKNKFWDKPMKETFLLITKTVSYNLSIKFIQKNLET